MATKLIYKSIPVIPLRGIVVFPDLRFHFEVGRKKSIAAVDKAMSEDQLVLLVTQKDISVEDPQPDELFKIGVIAVIRQINKDSETGSYKIVVETNTLKERNNKFS